MHSNIFQYIPYSTAAKGTALVNDAIDAIPLGSEPRGLSGEAETSTSQADNASAHPCLRNAEKIFIHHFS